MTNPKIYIEVKENLFGFRLNELKVEKKLAKMNKQQLTWFRLIE